MNETVKNLLETIEAARAQGQLSNDAARAASVALTLKGDEAMLACRLIAQGPDPSSLEYLLHGHVSDKVARAHREGPGIYEPDDPERTHWLTLAALSADESKDVGLRTRVAQFTAALDQYRGSTGAQLAGLARRELERILKLPFAVVSVPFGEVETLSRRVRIYDDDSGFAAAYWDVRDPQEYAIVLGLHAEGPYAAVGSRGRSLDQLGLHVDKQLSPTFGIIQDQYVVKELRYRFDDEARVPSLEPEHVYRFLCKQGQDEAVRGVLLALGLAPRSTRGVDRLGNPDGSDHVLVTAPLREGFTKGLVDASMKANGIPGARG